MENQLDLFSKTNRAKFEAWKQTPGGARVMQIAYGITAQYARRFQRTGRMASIKLIWEQMRDNIAHIKARMQARGISLDKQDGFALNNNFHAYIARHIMEHKAEWNGLFETRGIKG